MYTANRYAEYKTPVFKFLKALSKDGAFSLRTIQMISNIVCGEFYFISDQFYVDHCDMGLMRNTEMVCGIPHRRPCFYSFLDCNTGLFWLIPISSKVIKYRAIYNKKIARYKVCDTIAFGYVMGNERAFLIQNMFPIIPKYIDCVYIDSITHNPVVIDKNFENSLQRKAFKILGLQRQGYTFIFPDVLKIESDLLLNP